MEIDALVAAVVEIDSYQEASAALVSLLQLDKTRAQELAQGILANDIGDVYFQATAFDVLYTASKFTGVDYICRHAASAEPYLLGAMLSAVAEDSGTLEGVDDLMRAVSCLRAALRLRPADELAKISSKVNWFNETYCVGGSHTT